MKAITSNKLFLASSKSRQDRILAALKNPINTELVQQLRSYLDDEYLTPQNLNPNDKSDDSNEIVNEPQNSNKNSNNVEDKHSSVKRNGSNISHISDEYEFNKDLEDEDTVLDKPDGNSDDSSENDTDKDSKVTSSTILSSTCLDDKLQTVVEEIKGLLNSRNDTQYVNRIIKKDNELWIYYEDKVNLNNVMGSVIELLNASGYTYLEFNRLARTDNAIVFQIDNIDTENVIKPSKVNSVEP